MSDVGCTSLTLEVLFTISLFQWPYVINCGPAQSFLSIKLYSEIITDLKLVFERYFYLEIIIGLQ